MRANQAVIVLRVWKTMEMVRGVLSIPVLIKVGTYSDSGLHSSPVPSFVVNQRSCTRCGSPVDT